MPAQKAVGRPLLARPNPEANNRADRSIKPIASPVPSVCVAPLGARSGQALAAGSQGVSIEAIEARLRRVVADELAPVQQALARIEAVATTPKVVDGGSPVSTMRERRRRRSR
jgi:hypothetical protein